MKLIKLLLAVGILMVSPHQAHGSLSALQKSVGSVAVIGITNLACYGYNKNKNIIPTADKYFKDETDNAAIVDKKFINDAHRLKYLENAFKDYRLHDDVSFAFIARLFRYSEKNDLDKIINIFKMHENEKKSKTISMNEVNKAYIDFSISEDLQEVSASEKLIMKGDVSEVHKAKLISYHEAAHTLMTTLLPTSSLVYLGTRIRSGNYAGHMTVTNLYLSDVLDRPSGICQQIPFHRLEFDAKNQIKILLAGRFGAIICDEQLYENEDISDFKFYRSLDDKNNVPGYAIGKPYDDSDLGRAYKVAEDFIKWKKFNQGDLEYNNAIELDCRAPRDFYTKEGKYEFLEARVVYIDHDNNHREDIEFGLEVDAVLQECCEETYKILSKSANKEKLHTMANAIMKDGFIFTDKIYSIAGVAVPKHDFELTVTENIKRNAINWLAWTSKKMSFYERNHPQI